MGGRIALSRRGSMSIQNLNFLKVSYPGTPCILLSSSSSTYIIYREVCLTFLSLLKNIINLFKWLIVKLNICQILLLLLLFITTIVIFIFQCQPTPVGIALIDTCLYEKQVWMYDRVPRVE